MNKKTGETLPSVDSILSKLKSDGTFDQFRRTCLDHIQGEPSFRAYCEHLEVVSRRFLQSYKWRDSSTKNEVRGRLRDHALGVIVSPDIQVGTPLIDIVEKELQSKAKELLPKITATVESLREARAKQLSEVIISKEVTPVSSVQSIVTAPKSDYVDLSLPIDLPGLNPPAKPLKTPGKPENKPKMKKELQKVKPKPVPGVKTPKEGSKIKTASSKELKPVVEKEKPKVYRIPKKPKVDTTETKESSTASASVNEEKPEPNASHKSNPTDDSKPSRRSARLASQTDSNKTSSDNEHSEREVTPSTRKRRRTSGSKRAMILLSSDGSDISSDSYQSDSGDEEISSLQGTEESHKTTHHDMKGSSKKKSKLSKRVRESLSKSPPIVVTRYNRSVKPNRRYYNPSTEEEEDEPQISLEEVGPSYERDESLHPLTLDVTRPCDDGNMEILGNAFLMEDEKVKVVYEMFKPKPKALKVKKNLLKGIRSRKKTKSRISFFHHR